MKCYKCGCHLSEHDFCTACGADVSTYKRIMSASNRFYNEGLEKASVRDLSGAIVSLRQSLKFNKENIEARNLLGLVYFEMGEVVAALSEWVISKNIRPKKNIADDYINMIQTNQSQLDTINQTIKKYNQALIYCNQDSEDLAIIQLKKVLSLNPKFIRAHQLLALLYINAEDWEKAKRELDKCLKIDANNTTTLRYLNEVETQLMPEEGVKQPLTKKDKKPDVIRYQSGNEDIIQPVVRREARGVSSALNIGIGVAIGVAIAFFLILPAKIQSARATINDELRVVSEQSDAKTATITELEQQLNNLQAENEEMRVSLDGYQNTDGTLEAGDALMSAVTSYITDPEDLELIDKYMAQLGVEQLSEVNSQSFINLYNAFLETVGPDLSKKCYEKGYDDYEKELYPDAIAELDKAYRYDKENTNALFYLGNAYRKNGDETKAKDIYSSYIDTYPDAENVERATTYLAELMNENE